MSIDKRTLAQTAQEVPQPTKKGFAGRPGLLSGLFEGVKHKGEEDLLSSRFVLETVMQLVEAKKTLESYETLVIEEASIISQRRATAATQLAVPIPVIEEKPENEEDALLAAIKRIGLNAKITGRRSASSGNFMFNLELDDKNHGWVMIPKETMQKEDPVAFAEEMARKQGVRTRSEVQEEILERRRASRPPSVNIEGLGIDKTELDRRSVTFEGEAKGQHYFTYLPEEIGSTFCISSEFSGRGLLAEIDRIVFSMHIQFQKPFVASILEESTSSVKSTDGIELIAQGGIKAISKALHVLANATEVDEKLIPPEYQDSMRRIKKSKRFTEYNYLSSRGILTKDEAETFTVAFEKIAHPSAEILRSWLKLHTHDGHSLSKVDEEALKGMLSRLDRNPLGTSEKALRNLAEAYGILVGDDGAKDWDLAKLESKYLEMTLRLRKTIFETIPEEMRKLID